MATIASSHLPANDFTVENTQSWFKLHANSMKQLPVATVRIITNARLFFIDTLDEV